MAKHRPEVVYGQPVPQDWFDALQEYISTLASNFVLAISAGTSVQLVAGTGSSLVALGINGKWRFRTTTLTQAHPGGAAGVYDIWAVASDNSFTAGGSTGEVDNTDYTFGLVIQATGGAAPTGTYNAKAIAHSRLVGTLTWSGSAITDVRQTVGGGGVPKHASTHAPGAGDAIDYTLVNLLGTLAARPAAATANAGLIYFATDSNGGTLFRSTGAAWTQVSYGLTSAPQPHAASHAPAGADALPWTTIHGYGTLASRPAVATTNAGYVYYATDSGTFYRSNGTSYDTLLILPFAHAASHLGGGSDAISWATVINSGIASARPAAAAANSGYLWFSTDAAGGTLYRSTGAAWVQVAAALTHGATHLPGSTDPLAWTTINGYGTLASRPTAASTNTGLLYYATDNTTLYRSNGTTWDTLSAAAPSNAAIASAINTVGTLASRPAAAAGNAGFLYFATDAQAGSLYRSDGAAWLLIAQLGVGINTQTASYTLALTDAGKVVEINAAGANILTVPVNASVAFPIGTTITVGQYGAGQTTFAASGGVLLRAAPGLKIAAQYGMATLIKRATDEWWLSGNLVP